MFVFCSSASCISSEGAYSVPAGHYYLVHSARRGADQPALCMDIVMTNGQNMTQEQLLMGVDLLNVNMIVIIENLLDARLAAASGASVPRPPTEQDYGELVQLLYERGVPEDQLLALFNEDMTHPQFCQAQIAFLTL